MDDLVAEFITETSESLAQLDSELVILEQRPDDAEILGNIFRLVHTIKGTCGFLGLPRLESVAHAGENVLGKVRDKQIKVTPATISIILDALDRIKEIMEYLSEHMKEPEGDDTILTGRLNAYADSNGATDNAGEAQASVSPTIAELDALFAKPSAEKPPAEEAPQEVDQAAPVALVKQEVVALAPEAEDEAVRLGLALGQADDPNKLGNQSIRVSLSVLENLMQMVGELVLTRNQLLQLSRNKDNDEFTTPLQHLSYITSELQEGVMKTRMQPIGNAWAKFPRLIRDLSIELGKNIELKMIGSETELDRQLLEMIKDPLTHMVRNSCDHGLEPPADRKAAGKTEKGTVTLSAYHEGGHIIIEITDDGRGIKPSLISRKAIEKGLATAEDIAAMTDNQIIQFIFKPGFSTAEKITAVSGRGVGMDVVRTNIEKIGGTVELHSKEGQGSRFHIKIPLTLAIVSVLIVETSGQRFAIPQINVEELVKTGEDVGHKVEMINRSPVLRLRDKLLPLISLSHLLDMKAAHDINYDDAFIVVCKVGGSEFGLILDGIHDTEEIVVKPVSRCLQHIPVYSGNTVLGDGSVIMILDPNGIARSTEAELEMTNNAAKKLQNTHAPARELVKFLLFRTADSAPKAVALELVSRLEEINASIIEYSHNKPVVQYRGSLMQLTTLDGQHMPQSGTYQVIVFQYDSKTVGLVVNNIADIASAEPYVTLSSDEPLYHGSIVINGVTTDIVDVGALLSSILQKSVSMRKFVDDQPCAARVLLVEDSMFFRNLTVPFLSEVGFQVVAVPSGKDALEIMDKQGFDAVVTDIEMPHMDGFELATKLRSREKFNHIPIFAFTSTSNETIEQRVVQSGMQGCVLKTEREKLIHLISDTLEHIMVDAVIDSMMMEKA
jgi:two-component system, chemotaxis family, sensor kinase CheA